MRTTCIGILAMLCAGLGCASDAECPDGYVLDGTCVQQSPDAGGGGNTMHPHDAGGDGDGDGDGDDDDASVSEPGDECALEPEFEGGFHAPCSDAVSHSECTCEADYCAVMPGAAEGFCTVTGCVEAPEKCPDGWSCFDLSAFGIDMSFCNPP